MHRALDNALTAALVPLMVITAVVAWISFPVAGIALAIDGKWALILWGIGVAVALPFIYAIASIPKVGIVLASHWLLKKTGAAAIFAKPLGLLLVIFGIVYNLVLIYIVVSSVFMYLPDVAGVARQDNLNGSHAYYDWYPYYDWKTLLWCYAVVAAAFSYMLSKESEENQGTTYMVLFTMILALLLFVVFLLRWSALSIGILLGVWFVAVVAFVGIMELAKRGQQT